MPTKRWLPAAVCNGNFLIVAGGYDGINYLATVEVLDTDTRQWSVACSLPYPLQQATNLICGEKLYMLGDWQCDTLCPQLLCPRITPVLPDTATSWESTNSTSQHVYSMARRWQLVVVGGRDETDKDTSTITVYNETTDSWEAMGDMSTGRRLALVAVLNGKMVVVGGWVGGYIGTSTDVVEIIVLN